MCVKKHSTMVFTFVALGLLLGVIIFSFSVRSDNGIKMLNGVGIHEFDLSEMGVLSSKGFIEVENKENYTVNITVYASNDIGA